MATTGARIENGTRAQAGNRAVIGGLFPIAFSLAHGVRPGGLVTRAFPADQDHRRNPDSTVGRGVYLTNLDTTDGCPMGA